MILNSGTALLPAGTFDEGYTNFTFVARRFGCGNLGPREEVECMRGVKSEDLEVFLREYNDNGTSPALLFSPIIDECTKFSNYTAKTLAGGFSKVVSTLPMSFGLHC